MGLFFVVMALAVLFGKPLAKLYDKFDSFMERVLGL
jgi:hypothetical protein